CFFFFSSRRRHTRSKRDWSSDVCSSDLFINASLLVPWYIVNKICCERIVLLKKFKSLPKIILYMIQETIFIIYTNFIEFLFNIRSEERRVGKESISRMWRDN